MFICNGLVVILQTIIFTVTITFAIIIRTTMYLYSYDRLLLNATQKKLLSIAEENFRLQIK